MDGFMQVKESAVEPATAAEGDAHAGESALANRGGRVGMGTWACSFAVAERALGLACLPNLLLLWTKSTPSRNPVQTPTSPTRTAPKPSYSQVTIRRPLESAIKPGQGPATKENLRPHDPGKSPSHDLAHDLSRDIQALKQARDLTARDRGNLTHDLPRDWSSTRSPDRTRFLRASCLLIKMWKTMGTINS